MTAKESLMDIDRILQPIAERDTSSRLQLRRRRDFLFEAEEAYENYYLYGPEFDGQPAPDLPGWASFVSDAEAYLSTKCKDLWVVAWWLEALTKEDGFEGLGGGLEVLFKICTEHWDQVYPDPSEEGGLEYTLKMIGGFSLGDHFEECLLGIPITPAIGTERPATCGTIEQLDASVRANLTGEASKDFVLSIHNQLKQCAETWNKIDAYLDEEFPGHQVPFAKVGDVLAGCSRTIANTYP